MMEIRPALFRLADSRRTRAFGVTIQPILLRRCENEFKLTGLPFYLFEYSFGSIPISMSNMLKSEVVAVKRGLKSRCAIDEK